MTAEEENKLLRVRLEIASNVLNDIADIQSNTKSNVFVFPLEIEALARRCLAASISAQQVLKQMNHIQLIKH